MSKDTKKVALIGAGAVLGGPIGAVAGAALADATSPQNEGHLKTEPVAMPVAMPVANEATARQARRRSLVSQMSRRGRASTILSRETLG